jgi:hypothetical protein
MKPTSPCLSSFGKSTFTLDLQHFMLHHDQPAPIDVLGTRIDVELLTVELLVSTSSSVQLRCAEDMPQVDKGASKERGIILRAGRLYPASAGEGTVDIMKT